jgi:NADH dehydrogenase FAD-containing subunit
LLAEVSGGTINPSDGVSLLRQSLPVDAVTEADVLEIDCATETVEATLGGASRTRTSSCEQLVIALGQAVASSRTPGLAACALVMKDPMDPPASTLVVKIH